MTPDVTGGSAQTSPEVGPGLYHYTNMDGDVPTRFHLRVDPDGGGLLLANSAEAAHLSRVGVLMVNGALAGMDDAALTAQVREQFSGGSQAEIADDLARVRSLIAGLASPDDNYPVTNFGDADDAAHTRRLGAPFRADVLQGSPEQVVPILHKLWDAGIPHVTFLVRPGSDMARMARLVEAAEDIGMITGLRTVASWFTEEELRQVAFAGLDYLTVVMASRDAAEHDQMVGAPDSDVALRAFELCHEWELCPVAQVPLTDESADEIEDIVQYVADRGVRNLWFFALACLDDEQRADAGGAIPARGIAQIVTTVVEAAEDHDMRFIWQPPVKFNADLSLPQHIIAGPRASGDIAVRVEPDGAVYPPRGKRVAAGNLLTDDWPTIWSSACFARFRERVEAPKRCEVCQDLPISGPCPKDPAGWSDDTQDGEQQ